MITNDDAIKINDILEICGAARLNDAKEISYLNAIGAAVEDEEDCYKIAHLVLIDRLKNQTGQRNYSQVDRLKMLAKSKGFELENLKPEKKKATVKMFGFGVMS
ncbi:hypothetical protein ACWO80_003443 [Vibrio cholerae]